MADIGQTVRQILIANGVDQYQPIVIVVNDRLLTVREWDTVCPDPGSIINVKAEVAGGGGDGNKVLNTVLMVAVIAIAIYAPYAAGLVLKSGALTMGGAMLSAGIMIAGSLIVNALVPILPPSAATIDTASGSNATSSPTYNLSGGSNSIRPYQSMPIVMGTHRFFPDLGALPYTEYRDNDQYLYQIFHFGLSDLTLTDFKIGTNDLTNYSEYTWYDQEPATLVSVAPAKESTFPGNAKIRPSDS